MQPSRPKEAAALALVREQLAAARRPIVMCSFGKDSIVVLHLALRIKKVPVLWLRRAKLQEKFEHAYRVVQAWDLEVFDLMPSATLEWQQGSYFEVLELFRVGPNENIVLVDGVRPRREEDGERFFCAVEDLLARPKALGMEYPWDVTFNGHKACDAAHLADRLEHKTAVYQGVGTRTVFPLHDWTDEDVWTYIRTYDLPYDRQRYDEGNDAYNDQLPTCYACVDTTKRGEQVYCPKLRRPILNQAKTAEQHTATRQAILAVPTYCVPVGEGATKPL